MKVLALDISTKAGYAVLEGDRGEVPQIVEKGPIALGRTVFDYGTYPRNYPAAASAMADLLMKKVVDHRPDVVVIEETNLGKNRYSQKQLEFLHAFFLREMGACAEIPVVYISSSSWRSTLGLQMTKEDKKNNSILSKAKKQAETTGAKLDKGALGVKGKVNKKHLAVRWANSTFGLTLLMKDNDTADALALGTAYLMGATVCDGT